jgi:hypothetical protein
MRRTAAGNQNRSLLLERGLAQPKGRSHLDEKLLRILEDAELSLSDSFRILLAQLKLGLEQTGSTHGADGYGHPENGERK